MTILIEAKKKIEKTTDKDDDEIINKAFVCLNRCLISRVILHYNPELNEVKERTFVCPNEECDYSSKWEYLPAHRKRCVMKDNEFKMNLSYWLYVYTQKEEIEYKVKKEFYQMLEVQYIEAYRIAEFERQVEAGWKIQTSKTIKPKVAESIELQSE